MFGCGYADATNSDHNYTSEIQPERNSTDTHRHHQVNFWVLHAFGYKFAPRYRDLHKKMGGLFGFHQSRVSAGSYATGLSGPLAHPDNRSRTCDAGRG